MMYKSLVIVAFILLGDITSAMETETKTSETKLEDSSSICEPFKSAEHQGILDKVNKIMDETENMVPYFENISLGKCAEIKKLAGEPIIFYCGCLKNEEENKHHEVIIAYKKYKNLCSVKGRKTMGNLLACIVGAIVFAILFMVFSWIVRKIFNATFGHWCTTKTKAVKVLNIDAMNARKEWDVNDMSLKEELKGDQTAEYIMQTPVEFLEGPKSSTILSLNETFTV